MSLNDTYDRKLSVTFTFFSSPHPAGEFSWRSLRTVNCKKLNESEININTHTKHKTYKK